jgi:hypothetical protein
MAQKKGKTGNPNGRPKGTPNKVTSDLRTWVNDILNDNRKQFTADLKQLEPHQRVSVFEKLLSYAVPKMQSVEAKIDLEKLSDEQLDIIINELTKDLSNE